MLKDSKLNRVNADAAGAAFTGPAPGKQTGWICLLLALITVGTYLPAFKLGFVNFDDISYVTGNPVTSKGLTWEGMGWALRARVASNWHPLTWISHMADCQLYGLKPAGHHATSLALHVANTLLLFLLLRRMTGAQWRPAVVAALFALHPLHVESVAWVAAAQRRAEHLLRVALPVRVCALRGEGR